ncbi:MAG TPA: 2OG-Fe(II) oxygenase family protein [Jatrophihabitans sp.]|nr:2OG-Fe(II) oxygenase family protein [Jatrophihabitans sp.]
MTELAVVDWNAPAAAVRFTESLRSTGFAVLRNHPIRPAAVAELYQEWDAFLGSEAKHAYRANGTQVGFFPHHPADAAAGLDAKEYFQVGDGGAYPAEVGDGARRLLATGKAMGATLLGWLQQQLPAERVAALSEPLPEMLRGSALCLLRLQRYLPAAEASPVGAIRALAHTDLNLLTILPSPTGPGLQLRHRDGSWYDVPCDPGSAIVNAGEMLTLATGGYFPATEHRVVTAERHQRGSRYSFPIFLHARPEVRLSAEHTAASYLARRIRDLQELGWKPAPGGAPRAAGTTP